MFSSFVKSACCFFGIMVSVTTLHLNVQSRADTGFNYNLSNAKWIPGGDAIIITLFQIDKRQKKPPVGHIYLYLINSKKFEKLNINGGSLAVSPDGKKIAYIKRSANAGDLFIYDIPAKKDFPIVTDSSQKFVPEWSYDGKMIAYISRDSKNRQSPVKIFVVDVKSGKSKNISGDNSFNHYNPVWSLDDYRIVYYVERGDSHDQIWLTDAEGSFHTNLTNDTSTHNYFPVWIDKTTIGYTQHSEKIVTIGVDGKNQTLITGLTTDRLRFEPKTRKALYVVEVPENKVMIYDWESRNTSVLFTLDDVLDFTSGK
jgi:hypothetical protein